MAVVKDTVTPFLKKLPAAVDNAIETAFEKWLDRVVKKMKDRVPVDTGNLMNSIRWQKDSKNRYSLEVAEDKAPYAPYIEYGTFKMRAQPFFNPTLNEMEPELLDMIKGKWIK